MAAVVLGIISLLFVLIGLIPFLGFMIWIALPMLIIGVALGISGIVKNKRRGLNITGTVICGICIVIGCIRISAGISATKKAVESTPGFIEKMKDAADELQNLSDTLNK